MQKSLIRLASRLAPQQVSNFAYRQLLNPQVHKLRPFEEAILDEAERSTMDFQGYQIATYRWPGPGRKILLIHGWEGQAGNFGDVIQALRQEGYDLYAFDAPSHGFSSKGETSMFEFTDLVKDLILRYGVKDLLSHSFGGVATTYALSQLPGVVIDRYLLLTTPDRFTERIDDVAKAVGINKRVKDLLKARLAEETGFDLAALNVSDFVKQIEVRQALIIHDEADKVIPIVRSLNVANNWPEAEFETVRGTGHFRILRDVSVIEKVVAFFATEEGN